MTLPELWEPSLSTAPLSPEFPSEWDYYGPIFRVVWKRAFNITLDAWQEWLLRRIMEVYPPGHIKAGQLRYRQVVVSMGRQNGKTEIGAIVSLWGLLRQPGSNTIGIASSSDQARLVYDRANRAVAGNPSLEAKFRKLTDTRGLRALDGSRYEIKAARSASLQGIPVHTGLADELHLLPSTLWTDLVNGTGGRPNAIVIGITTAGSEDSELLKNLYETGLDAAEGNPALENFGFFLWESPEATVPEDDESLLKLLIAANPALASGRIDAANVLADVRAMPASEVIRYRLNRFTASTNAYISMDAWSKCRRELGETLPSGRVVFCVDQTSSQSYATVSAAVLDAEGVTHTQLVAWINAPDLAQLVRVCERLWKHNPATYAMDTYTLRPLAEELKKRGLPVTIIGRGDNVNATALLASKVMRGKLRHAGDDLLSYQLPNALTKTVGDGYRIIPSVTEIDALQATIGAVFAAESAGQDQVLQVF